MRSRQATSLSLGAQGDEIMHLQNRLSQLGYEPGEIDGHFGYLTDAAVRTLQRDFRLRVDGVIGPQVKTLLKQDDLPDRRRLYTLRAGETLVDAARTLNVYLEALCQMNRLSTRARGYPGQRLICRTHYVLACLSPHTLGARSTFNSMHMWSAIALPLVTVQEGSLQVTTLPPSTTERIANTLLPCWLAVQPAQLLSGTLSDITPLLRWRKARKAAVHQLAALAKANQAGIWLDFCRLGWGDGAGYLELVRSLRQLLAPLHQPLMVTLPLPGGEHRRRWWLTDIDYKAITTLADKVVIGSHVAQACDSFLLHVQRIESVLNMIPGWKALLGIALRAEERDEAGELISEQGYAKALATAYLAGAKPRWEASRKLLQAQIVPRPPKAPKASRAATADANSTPARTLWLPGRDALMARLSLAHRLSIDGVALWPVGEEDTRIWPVMPKLLIPVRAEQSNTSKK